jgi:signal transduction histidine kinase
VQRCSNMRSTDKSDTGTLVVRAAPSTPERVYWACVAGILVWALLRELGVDPDAAPLRLLPFVGVLAVAAANLILRNRYSAAMRAKQLAPPDRQGGPMGWIFVAVDFLTIVAGLRFSGGLHSAVWVVSFVVLAGETVLERRREAAITRLAACIAIFFGTIPLPPEKIDWPAYLLEMYVRMGLLIAVSSVMRRLRERSENHMAEISNLRAELALADQRASIAREIHDGVGNSLAGAVLRLELAARTIGTSGDALPPAQMLKEEAQALRNAMTAVRDWTFLNHPWNAPADAPLSEIIDHETRRWTSRTGIPVDVSGLDDLDALPQRFHVPVLRILQESLTNVAKHAGQPSKVCLSATRTGRKLVIEASDDGLGIQSGLESSGLGLASMKDRATGIGARLTVQPNAGKGTCVRLELNTPART